MKTMFIFAALALLAPSIKAQDSRPPDLPGKTDAAEEAQFQRPDAQRILSDLSAELRLSSKQEQRITDVVKKKAKEFDKLFSEYEKASAEEKKWRTKVSDLKYGMNGINKGIPDAIRDFLDDEQRQTFDSMLENVRASRAAAAEAKQEAAPAPAAAAPKQAKKRKLIKKKKMRAGTESTNAAPAAASPEDEPGLTMVDKDPSAGSGNAPAPKKKRVLKKRSPVAPAAVRGEDEGAAEPAGAQPTGKEAPAEEDAGSYP